MLYEQEATALEDTMRTKRKAGRHQIVTDAFGLAHKNMQKAAAAVATVAAEVAARVSPTSSPAKKKAK